MENLTSPRQGALTYHAAATALRPQWNDLLASLYADSSASDCIFADLVARYSTADRAYHTLDHVRDVLLAAEPLLPQAYDPAAVLLAIWFHDVVYSVQDKVDSERESAELASERLQLMGLRPNRVRYIHQLILDTKHQVPPQTVDGCIVVDADLSSFAVPPAEFRRNTERLRHEFAHVSDTQFRNGRLHVLQQFLARDRIYYTNEMHDRYEEAARANLKNAVSRLRFGAALVHVHGG